MIAARLMLARALAGTNPAWIAGGALILIAIVVYAIVRSGRKEGYAPASSTKYKHWGWKGTKNEGLMCKNNNNTGCTTKWEGGKLVDLETPSTPAPSSAKKKDGESCSGGNQCQSGLCSKEKRCYSIGCPKTGATVWHAKTRKCLWPCGSGKERNDKGECVATGSPAPSSAKKKDGESCSGGNQCQSGLCSKEKRCYSVGCPKTGATVWHAKTRKCLWPCGSGKERNDKGECVEKSAATKYADEGIYSRYPYWGKKGTKFEGLRCSKSDGVTGCDTKWVGGKLKDVGTTAKPEKKGSSATLDVVRKYPHWGWRGTKNEGLKCKNNDNTGCTTKWKGGRLMDLEKPNDVCPFAWQTKNEKGKCVGCPPDKPKWDKVKKQCVAEKKGSSATLDVVRKYPFWGWRGTKNEGLKCKNNDNTGCTTKWVDNRLVDLEKPNDVCPFAWQTKNEKGKCVGCPPGKPKWDKVKKECTSGCKFTWQVLDSKGKCVGCPPDKPSWDNAKKQCVASTAPGAAPVPNLASIPAPVAPLPCSGNSYRKTEGGMCYGCVNGQVVDGASGTKECKCNQGWTGEFCTKEAAPAPVALDCKDPKHWVNDQCVCKDPNRSDGADGSWCTVNKAEESWNWRKNQCAQIGGYVCSEKNVGWDETPKTGNPKYRGADVPNQCCVDTKFGCPGIAGMFRDANLRSSKAWSPDNKGCNVDVYRATDYEPLGVNNGCGGALAVFGQVFPPTRGIAVAVGLGKRIAEGDSCNEYVDMDAPQELPDATDFY